jgi:hypothetical protein
MNWEGLRGDGCDCAGARKRPQNDLWGVVNSARKQNKILFLNLKKEAS